MTPYEIKLLIHYYCSPGDYRPNSGDIIFADTLAGMVKQDLLFLYSETAKLDNGFDRVYKITDRGRAHIEQLCNLPLPQRAWVNKNGELIQVE